MCLRFHCAQASTPAFTSPLHSNGNHLAGSPLQADRSVHSQRLLLFNLLPPGEACAIQPLEGAAPLAGLADFAMQDELHSQLFLPAPRYVLVRCSCLHEATCALWQLLTGLLH